VSPWLAFGGPVLGVLVYRGLLIEYLLPSPSVKSLCELANTHRRFWEGRGTCEKRCISAMRAYDAVSRAFIKEAERHGTRTQLSELAFTLSLPGNHPLSVQLLQVKYPDGPPIEEFEKLVGIRCPPDLPQGSA
jgi:hypothetical protein